MAKVCLGPGGGRVGEGQALELEELEKRPLLPDRLVQAPVLQVLFALGTGVMRVLRVARAYCQMSSSLITSPGQANRPDRQGHHSSYTRTPGAFL